MKKILLVFMILFNFTFSFTYKYNGGNYTIDDKKIENAFSIGINNFTQQYGDLIDKEEILLGGCMILPNSFNYYCINCQSEIYLEEEK
jgi:hypothetical protein